MPFVATCQPLYGSALSLSIAGGGDTPHKKDWRRPKEYVVEVTDDGVGLPDAKPTSLGLEIVETLVREDLRGRLSFKSTAHGTEVLVRLPRALDEANDE